MGVCLQQMPARGTALGLYWCAAALAAAGKGMEGGKTGDKALSCPASELTLT